ncbi:MAG: DUF4331 domain-containing protein [Rhizobiales bacterium]|nr:DUF4331 domain-containing protein [Hyphomicrobiales bacterium]
MKRGFAHDNRIPDRCAVRARYFCGRFAFWCSRARPSRGDGDLTGPVETTLTRDGVRVRAGLFDDPFFFDLQGFRETQSTGTLSFRNNRDFFAGTNLTAVVIEIPRSRLANGTNPLDIWAETARLGGQL